MLMVKDSYYILYYILEHFFKTQMANLTNECTFNEIGGILESANSWWGVLLYSLYNVVPHTVFKLSK